MKNNILIVGGSGFIGLNIIDKHLDDKKTDKIYVFGDLNFIKRIKDIKGKIIFLGFYNEKTNLKFLKNVNVIYYLIGGLHTKSSYQFDTIKKNIYSFKSEIFNNNLNIKFVYFSSSGGIYNDSKKFKTELCSTYANNNYSKIKLDTENFLMKISDDIFSPIIIRPSNIYGKYQETQVNINGIITTLIYNSLIGKETTIPENYKLIYRDYLRVEDLIRFTDLILKSGKGIYNISYGYSYSIYEIIQFLKSFNIDPKIKFSKSHRFLNSFISNNKIKNELSIDPEINIKDGISMQINYLTWLLK